MLYFALFLSLLLGTLTIGQIAGANDKQCNQLVNRIIAGSATPLRTLGQLSTHLVLITADNVVYDVPATNLHATRLYLNGTSRAEQMRIKWPPLRKNAHFRSFAPNGTFLAVSMAPGKGTVLVVGVQATSRFFHTVWCDTNYNFCNTETADYKFDQSESFQDRFAFINSPEERVFYRLLEEDVPSKTTYSLIKYFINSTSIHRIQSSPITTSLNLSQPLFGFTGFTSTSHLYLFGPSLVYIRENRNQTWTTTALKEFFSCGDGDHHTAGDESAEMQPELIFERGPVVHSNSGLYTMFGLFVLGVILSAFIDRYKRSKGRRGGRKSMFPKIQYKATTSSSGQD